MDTKGKQWKINLNHRVSPEQCMVFNTIMAIMQTSAFNAVSQFLHRAASLQTGHRLQHYHSIYLQTNVQSTTLHYGTSTEQYPVFNSL